MTYFYGALPVVSHAENDLASFNMITAPFYLNGYVKQMDIVRAFGVTPISVKRAVKRFQEEDPQGFYTERVPECGRINSSITIKKMNFIPETPTIQIINFS